ncbi:MAG: MarR family transcriptional regulator [Pseudomonadota bacterium]
MSRETQTIIQHWREAAPNDRLAHLIKDAARSLTRALQVRMAEAGVPVGHWTFLRVLWESDGLTQRELSERAGVMEPSTFAAMQAMEALGYITRERLPNNRKNVYIHLTRKGRALEKKLVPIAEETNRVSVEGIPAKNISIVRETLLQMIENLARDEMAQELDEATPAVASPKVRATKSRAA